MIWIEMFSNLDNLTILNIKSILVLWLIINSILKIYGYFKKKIQLIILGIKSMF